MASCSLPSTHSIENLFSLSVLHGLTTTDITMTMLHPVVSTRNLSTIIPLLQEHLPEVLKSTCFNDEDLPFFIEVQNTEIGHLFEHIMLEYLCQMKIALSSVNHVEFSGRTSWNWVKEQTGIFHITIDISTDDLTLFQPAMRKTIDLVSLILNPSIQRQPTVPSSSYIDVRPVTIQ